MVCSVKTSGAKWSSPINLVKIIFFGVLCLIGYTNVCTTIYRIVNGITTFGDK